MLAATSLGLEASPMLREIVDRIESSDAVVYLVCEPSRRPGVAAHLSFIDVGRRVMRDAAAHAAAAAAIVHTTR